MGDREFINPSEVVCVGGMGFYVKDQKGIMMFKMQGKFVRKGEVDKLNTCSGMAGKEKVVKRVEMVDIIAKREKTICKALKMYKDKLYVVDNGLDCVYTLFNEDGRISPRSLAALGGVVWRGVSAVVLDDEGNSVISDTRNNRLQLFSSEWEFVGFVKVIFTISLSLYLY